ncbi:MAG: hypothetical protein LBV79_09380 [Candidatus Adiutrix sp.]|jgi:type IV secretory pathway VirB10-like protein|nr:hypothetical protein [Candidatus Adiutrix sp.]
MATRHLSTLASTASILASTALISDFSSRIYYHFYWTRFQGAGHYLRIFGSAVLMPLVSGGMSYAVDQVSNTSSDSDSTSVQNEMTAALAAQLGQTTLQLLQKNLNIKPTLEIRPGYQFNVIVTKDVIFREAYAVH